MDRIGGVDVARGLAVLGMMTAHVGVAAENDLWSTDGWLGVADGRSAALFAVLAGLSIALLSGGRRPVEGDRLRRARVRIVTRGVLLFGLGTFLAALGAPIAVILQSYAVLFVLALPMLRLPPRALLLVAAAVVIAAPPLCFAVTDALTASGDPPTGLLELLVAEYYPAAIWQAYVLTGLAVGRCDLRAPAVRRGLLLAGAGAAVAGYGGGVLATGFATGQPPSVLRLLSTEPHADSTFEVVGNTGVALVVIATCLLLADRWPRLVAPLAATGALALTAYSTHIVVIAAMGPQVVREPRVTVHLGFLVVTLVLCTAWRATLGRGPLERAMHAVSTAIAGSVVAGGDTGAPREPGAGPHPEPRPHPAVESRPHPAVESRPDPAVEPRPDRRAEAGQGQTSVRSQPAPPRW